MRLIDAQDTRPDATLRLDNHDDVLALADAVMGAPAVELQFPQWTDGRAYSQAVLLRGRLRYTGEIRAVGEVLVDMLPLLRRCGFDAVRLRADQNLETARRTLSFLPAPYQREPAAQRGAPIAAGPQCPTPSNATPAAPVASPPTSPTPPRCCAKPPRAAPGASSRSAAWASKAWC